MFKVGDRVIAIKGQTTLGIKEGDKATVMAIGLSLDVTDIFINTDKLNNYNQPNHNGNGLLYTSKSLKLLYHVGKWSDNEIDYLHSYYRRKSITEIAESLQRTYSSIQSKAQSEGLHKHPRRNYNECDISAIKHMLVDRLPIDIIGINLHRSKSSIGGKIALMRKREELQI